MGGWRLEIVKMAMYVSFPVAMFTYFNQPEYFEEWVVNTKRELYPPENTPEQELFKDEIRRIKKDQEQKRLKLLEHSVMK